MTSSRTVPVRSEAETVGSDELVRRILDAKAEDAWAVLRDTISPARQTMLPARRRHT
jgi:hypothetical protein